LPAGVEGVTYRIIINNQGTREAMMVVVEDIIPAGLSYVSSSTVRKSSNTMLNMSIPDGGSTAFPLDEGGVNLGDFESGQLDTIEFLTVTDGMTYSSVINGATVTTNDGRIFNVSTEIPMDQSFPNCSLEFTDAGFTGVPSYEENSTIFLSLEVPYLTGAGTIPVTLQNPGSSDVETVTLTETGAMTGIYQGSIPSSISAGGTQEDGTLLASGGDMINVSYTNNLYGDVCIDNAEITPPQFVKQLYMSEPGQGLDRIDPVASADMTIARSDTIGEVTATSPNYNGVSVWQLNNPGTDNLNPRFEIFDGTTEMFGTTMNLQAVAENRTDWMESAQSPTDDDEAFVVNI
jgi:uncharacterized repeat protein (TIGR01451 family)